MNENAFTSTRGTAPVTGLRDAIFRGLAPDGGLYLPVNIPEINIDKLPVDSYPELAGVVLGHWIGNAVERSKLESICRDAFNFAVPARPTRRRPVAECSRPRTLPWTNAVLQGFWRQNDGANHGRLPGCRKWACHNPGRNLG